MTRHILTQALIAASALTVLAAAPSAMAASDKPITAKVKKSQNFVKVADHKQDRFRNNRSQRNRSFNRRNGRSLGSISFNRRNSLLNRGFRNRGFNSRNIGFNSRNRGFNSHLSSPFRRTSSYFGGSRGFHTPYRSRLGISFNFGNLGYSRYRWSQSPYSLYQPTYGAYDSYQTQTTCRRVTLEGLHHGHRELVSVKQCSNPWDGTYIVQGSERLVACRY